MNCEHCNKKITEYKEPEILQDKQCFACGSFLTDEEISELKK
jgi:hypothetical protein